MYIFVCQFKHIYQNVIMYSYEGNYIEKSTKYDPKSCDHNDCFEISVDFIVHIQHANVMGSFGFGWWTYAAQSNTLCTKIFHVVQKLN